MEYIQSHTRAWNISVNTNFMFRWGNSLTIANICKLIVAGKKTYKFQILCDKSDNNFSIVVLKKQKNSFQLHYLL